MLWEQCGHFMAAVFSENSECRQQGLSTVPSGAGNGGATCISMGDIYLENGCPTEKNWF